MPKLILSMDGLVLKEIVLRQERLTIGRKPDNDVQIDNLAISGHHAVITTILDDAFLEDLNSTNGTYVNGLPVKKHVLHNNDVIELGKYRLKFLAESSPSWRSRSEPGDIAVPRAAGAETAAERPSSSGAAGAASALIDASSSAGSAPASSQGGGQSLGVVQILNGTNPGRELELSKAVTTLGKPGRQVAVISRRQQGYFITHVEGTSFPLVNGRPIGADPRALVSGDRIDIAGVQMAFLLRP